jgi:23S rRNA pseudouridine1911/1915/1917 synthase
VVTPRWEGERLDLFLAASTSLSRRRSRRLATDGMVLRNGEVLRVLSRTLQTGDVIDVLRPHEELGCPPVPSLEAPALLHIDHYLVAGAKPAGTLSQPSEQDPHAMSFDRQILLFLALEEGRKPFLRLVHRLDRLTSGAVLFARRPEILARLSGLWKEGRVERLYLAIVEGQPAFDVTTIDAPIARDPTHSWRFRVAEGGKPARTELKVLGRADHGPCTVLCRLVTGRTHQVRVHLAHIGHPVRGDRLYGAGLGGDAGRPLLHAVSLALPHPATGDTLSINCPPPEDIRSMLPEGFAVPTWQG